MRENVILSAINYKNDDQFPWHRSWRGRSRSSTTSKFPCNHAFFFSSLFFNFSVLRCYLHIFVMPHFLWQLCNSIDFITLISFHIHLRKSVLDHPVRLYLFKITILINIRSMYLPFIHPSWNFHSDYFKINLVVLYM